MLHAHIAIPGTGLDLGQWHAPAAARAEAAPDPDRTAPVFAQHHFRLGQRRLVPPPVRADRQPGAVASQRIAGQNFYRPTDAKVAGEFAKQFPKLELFTIDQAFGGWTAADKAHFADGGSFDQIYVKK